MLNSTKNEPVDYKINNKNRVDKLQLNNNIAAATIASVAAHQYRQQYFPYDFNIYSNNTNNSTSGSVGTNSTNNNQKYYQQQQQPVLPQTIDVYKNAFLQYQYAASIARLQMQPQPQPEQQQPEQLAIRQAPIKKLYPHSPTPVLASHIPYYQTQPQQPHLQWSKSTTSSLSPSPSPSSTTTSPPYNQYAQPLTQIANNLYQQFYCEHNSYTSSNCHNQQQQHTVQNSVLKTCLNNGTQQIVTPLNNDYVQSSQYVNSNSNSNNNTSTNTIIKNDVDDDYGDDEDDDLSSSKMFLNGTSNNGGNYYCSDDDDDDMDSDLDNDENIEVVSNANSGDDQSFHNKSQNKQRKQNRKRQHDGNLYCCVCSAHANGYNFNAITCESCKAFFRRNAFRDLTMFRCANNDKCEINMATRKKCKKCRINKCFLMGMNKDWIMNEDERKMKKQKIEYNRNLKKMKMAQMNKDGQYQLKFNEQYMQNANELNSLILTNEILKEQYNEVAMKNAEQNESLFQSSNATTNVELMQSNIMPSLIIPPIMTQSTTKVVRRRRRRRKRLHEVFKNKIDQDKNDIEIEQELELLKNHNDEDNSKMCDTIVLDTTDNNNTETNKLNDDYSSIDNNTTQEDTESETSQSDDFYEYCGSDTDTLSETNRQQNTLKQDEIDLIKSIRKTYSIAINKINVMSKKKITQTKNVTETANLTGVAVKRLIHFFKLNEDFKELDSSTQSLILRLNMMEILLTQGAIAFNNKEKTFRDPYNKHREQELDANSLSITYDPATYARIIKYITELVKVSNNNHRIIMILLFCILFSIDKYSYKTEFNSQTLDKLQKYSSKYTSLLHAYMRTCFNTTDLDVRIKKIFELMVDARVLGAELSEIVIAKTEPKHADPLCQEIFCINKTKS